MNHKPASDTFGELDPSPRLLMGPGPVDVYPRVLRVMSTPMLGQFDPEFTRHMNEVMALYRQVFVTNNHWSILIDGTARSGIECCMTSMIEPGQKVLVPIMGRFGHLLAEIAERCGAEVVSIGTEWGRVFDPDEIGAAIRQHRPHMVATVQGDTSTTMCQPLDRLGKICREHDVLLYVDATASIAGNRLLTDEWMLDAVSAGLQKCLSGPPGISPITFNERVAKVVNGRKHIEGGIRPDDFVAARGPVIRSNYFDLAMLMDYWGPKRLNHHTEATTMLWAARECARVVLEEGLDNGIARHELTSRALRAGLEAMGLKLFGDPAYRMANVTGVWIPEAVIGEADAIRSEMLLDFGIEIGTSFGPLHGRIWRIGTMGHVCRKANVMRCLASLGMVLARHGCRVDPKAGIDAAYEAYAAT
ncbi:MAG: alanine--glyoxylate aminotransferase family protein [Geminicoccaceae bacterium]|nr:alanine--glyoxylate aminotransferase family protein [Geminicoccaceae bacterium]